MTTLKAVDQIGMDEQVLDDPELEKLLDIRAAAADKLARPKKAYAEADEEAKAAIVGRLEVGEVARVGRYRIERVHVPARHADFEVEAGSKVGIKAGDE